MLRELDITNYALIDKLNIDFQPGLNILTGETGSGKSIILGALSLVLGAKSTSSMIRAGQQQAVIQAVFDLHNCQELIAFLEEQELYEEEEDLIITRKIQLNGKSSCRINGRAAALSTLKELSRYLIDVYGQHDYVSLFKHDKQLELLDCYGGRELGSIKERTAELYNNWQECMQQYRELKGKTEDRNYREELLLFQISELEKAGLKPNEEEELAKEEFRLANAEKMKEKIVHAYSLLQADDSSLLDKMYQLSDDLMELKPLNADYQALAEKVNSWRYELEELAHDLSFEQENIDLDDYRLEAVQQRIYLINNLKKKYRTDFNGLYQRLAELKEELALLENSSQSLTELKKKAARLKQEYEKEAEALSGMRQAVAKVLTEKIVEELHNLNMKNVVFVIDFQKSAPQKQGMDKIEFRFSSNLGEKVFSLSEIASGGELSRVMLALKVILAKIDQIPVLIFDEIDTGIGGQTAQIVGEKMALLAKERQVICVTHAPQIACQAHSHFVISKKIADGRTATQIVKLNKTGRIEELCRMLGEINELTRQYAKEMLKGKSIE